MATNQDEIQEEFSIDQKKVKISLKLCSSNPLSVLNIFFSARQCSSGPQIRLDKNYGLFQRSIYRNSTENCSEIYYFHQSSRITFLVRRRGLFFIESINLFSIMFYQMLNFNQLLNEKGTWKILSRTMNKTTLICKLKYITLFEPHATFADINPWYIAPFSTLESRKWENEVDLTRWSVVDLNKV